MTSRVKRSYHHGDLREALIAAAVSIIERHGPDSLTLREVAKRVGVSQAAPYHHFADKDAIIAAVAEEGFLKLSEAMEDARAAAGESVRARLRAAGVGYVRFAVRHPSHFRVMFSGKVPVGEYKELAAAGERAFTILMQSIAEGAEAGRLINKPLLEMAVIAWSMMHGLAMLHVNGVLDRRAGGAGTIDELTEAAADAVVRGLEK